MISVLTTILRVRTTILVQISEQRHRKVKCFSKGHTGSSVVCLQQDDEEYIYLLFSMNEFVVSIHILCIDLQEEDIGGDVLITARYKVKDVLAISF